MNSTNNVTKLPKTKPAIYDNGVSGGGPMIRLTALAMSSMALGVVIGAQVHFRQVQDSLNRIEDRLNQPQTVPLPQPDKPEPELNGLKFRPKLPTVWGHERTTLPEQPQVEISL